SPRPSRQAGVRRLLYGGLSRAAASARSPAPARPEPPTDVAEQTPAPARPNPRTEVADATPGPRVQCDQGLHRMKRRRRGLERRCRAPPGIPRTGAACAPTPEGCGGVVA